jgi:hypothetical protein
MALVNLPTFFAGHSLNDEPVLKTDIGLSSPLDKAQSTHLENAPITARDPRINDAPQLGSTTEWYYLQAHLDDGSAETSGEPSHTVVVCLFRQMTDPEIDPTSQHNWAVVYAHLDWKTKKYTTHCKVPPTMPTYAMKSLEGNQSLLSKTIRDMINNGPKGGEQPAFVPDELFTNTVQIRPSVEGESPALGLDWDNGASLVGQDGTYHLKVPELELDIQINATKPIMLHGNDGETLVGDKTVCPFLRVHQSTPLTTVRSLPCSTTAGHAARR